MAAYLIVDLETTDHALMDEYGKVVPATVEKYGGRFIVRGGKIEALEGNWHPKRLVVIEFPSMEQAKRWYDSEEYKHPKALRLRGSKGNLVLVDGAS